MITAELLKTIVAPKGKASIIASLAPALETHLPDVGVTTKLRLSHFLCQAGHEADGFNTLHEYWGPTTAQKGYDPATTYYLAS